MILPFTLSEGVPYEVDSSTPGSASAMLHTRRYSAFGGLRACSTTFRSFDVFFVVFFVRLFATGKILLQTRTGSRPGTPSRGCGFTAGRGPSRAHDAVQPRPSPRAFLWQTCRNSRRDEPFRKRRDRTPHEAP